MKTILTLTIPLMVFLSTGCATNTKATRIANHTVKITRGCPFSKPDGKQLKLTLYQPVDVSSVSRPGVILIHGGGWTLGFPGLKRWYGRKLAEAGYVAMSIEYRKMPGHPFPACLHDCKSAVRWLRSHAGEYNVDPERIVAFGDSAGGHLALLLATTRLQDGLEGEENPGVSSAVQAAVCFYPPSQMDYYLQPDSWLKMFGLTSRFMKRFVGAGLENSKQAFDAASPLTYIHPGMCPVMIVHGTDDTLVPYKQSDVFSNRARELGAPVRLLAVPNRGHAFDYSAPWIRERVFPSVLEFLNSHLGPHPAGD